MPRQANSPFNTTSRKKAPSNPCPDSPSGAHWWLLESPEAGQDGIVGAACRDCGATRTYGSGYVEKQWNTRIAQEVEA